MRRTGPKKQRATARLKRCFPEGERMRTKILPRGYATSRQRTSYGDETHRRTYPYTHIHTLSWSLLAPSARARLSILSSLAKAFYGKCLTCPQVLDTRDWQHALLCHLLCHHGGRSSGSSACLSVRLLSSNLTHYTGHRQWLWHVQGWL